MRYNMDVVIVDTGHSYSGLCAYYQGKYITYTKKKPITMNPFQISQEEYDIEKKDFLCTLIGVAWKGAEGTFTPVERDVISSVIGAYYSQYFNFRDFAGLSAKEQHGVRKRVLQQMRTGTAIDSDGDDSRWEDFDDMQQLEISRTDEVFLEEFGFEIPDGPGESTDPFEIAFEKAYQAALRKETAQARSRHEQDRIRLLNFNSFYEFALRRIPLIKTQEQISFAYDEFRYVLKKFYRGGEFSSILNEATDESLFTEKFIVFEIDAIKENRILFPIVTLIIMDVFIQKMRYRSQRRKTLVVEEAWKAIASPLMASYLLYLYKTVRKFWGEAIVVTQELGDIVGNAVVKDSIISNSDTICLLDQTKFRDDYEQISALLSIGEAERRKIFSINQLDNANGRDRFKEVYIRRGAVGEVYGVEVSIEQYLIFTTEKPEKSAVEIYVAAYGSYPTGIDQMVADLGRSKLPLGQFVSHVNRSGRPMN
jgi:type IV secretory pathway VirB4 component